MRIGGLPEALIRGREREVLRWFFRPYRCTRTWSIEPAFTEYLRVFSAPTPSGRGLNYYREAFPQDVVCDILAFWEAKPVPAGGAA